MKNVEDKVPDITNLATSTLNAEINQVKSEIPSITNLTTTATLTAVENEKNLMLVLQSKKLTITQN